MPADIHRNPKLLIVSDTPVWKTGDNGYISLEQVVKEIKSIEDLFKSISWIGFNYDDVPIFKNSLPIEGVNFIQLKKTGGSGLINKLKILADIVPNCLIIGREVRKADIIYTRGPSIPALITVLISAFYPSKLFWHKYAGDWFSPKIPTSYSLQRSLLNSRIVNGFVTVNGQKEKQRSNVLSFENPCLSTKELQEGKLITKNKEFGDSLELCFVGSIAEFKGIFLLLDALSNLEKTNQIKRIIRIHIAGEGPDSIKLDNFTLKSIEVIKYGFLNHERLVSIYSVCHAIVLPSRSEGFPKVIAEASNYGCIPIVSAISSIPQYIQQNENGFLINEVTVSHIESAIVQFTETKTEKLVQISKACNLLATKFTYEYFKMRVQKEIINSERKV